MDYGAMLKQRYHNPNRRSAQYQKQSPFKGSNRELRGMILRALTAHSRLSEAELVAKLNADSERVNHALKQLVAEGFITKDEHGVRIV
jgi:A/G-specific adenine glycosylase